VLPVSAGPDHRLVEAENTCAIVEKIDAWTEAPRLHPRYDDRSG